MRSAPGFSLTELVVALGVSAVLGTAALGYFRSQTQALGDQSLRLDATDKVRAAMTLMVRELRGTAYDPTATALSITGFKGVRYAGPTALWIELDKNGDGTIDGAATDPSAESIVYSYDTAGERLVRTVAGVSQTLIADVPPGALALTYFDQAGSALSPSGGASVTVPAGYPSLPASIAQALGGVGATALGAADRDAIAMIRVTLRVQTPGSASTTLTMGTRVSIPNRLLERL